MLFCLKLSHDKDWDEYDDMAEHVVETGSAVVECGILLPYELKWATKHSTSWYRSKGRKGEGDNPFASFMLNKKWTLEEDFNNHMLRFQQVIVSFDYFNKLHFNIPVWIDCHRKSFQSGRER